MPQDVFEYGVCTISKAVLSKKFSLNEVVEIIWQGYEKDIIDDGIKDDFELASLEAIEWLEENEAPAIKEFFHHFQWYCLHFDEEGKEREKKLLNGLFFTKSKQNLNRVADFLKRMKLYYFLAASGLAKLAPDEWDPSK